MELELTQLSEVKTSSLTHPNAAQTLHHFPVQQKPPNPDFIALHANPKISPPDFTRSSSIPFVGFVPISHLNGELSPNPSLCNSAAAAAFDDANRDHINPRHHSDHVSSVIHEKRLRRMISNRESARRSRLRKKKQVEELQMQVDQLRGANTALSEKLISLLESNHQILQENAQLKEKVSSLQVIMTDLLNPFRNVEEVACILKSEALNRSVG
ncbi:basic leucine zipper 43 [Rhodamnia argentea]|uniref:Basic leucine zipper 43 n=1 Tax=Rhodamnia argentea TaxID=178133 RepID=A0A8B8NH53_9MYRT|nr:basic leucine zipper 43 [Rhodamnia argentea]